MRLLYDKGYADGERVESYVLLKGGPGFRGFNIFGVGEELSLASGKRVDVYEVSELVDGPFRDAVLAEAVAL